MNYTNIMTLEYLEIMEDVKARRKLQKSFKSNTRIYDDGSIEIDPKAQGEPELPKGEFLIDKPNLKVCLAQQDGKVSAWLTFETKGLLEARRELYSLTIEIDKCFVINETLVAPQK